MEKMLPDYSIYPQYSFAVAYTTKGCPRGCGFCHVKDKEGLISHKVANVDAFWAGQDYISVCDPNITACKDKLDLFQQYKDTGAAIEFNQGLDIRLLNDKDIEILTTMNLKRLHLAWDNPNDNLEEKFRNFSENYKPKQKPWHGNKGTVYVLTNYENCSTQEHIERALHRVEILKSLQFAPFIMVYDKPNAAHELRQLQRYVNNKFVFYKIKSFEEYRAI